MRTTILVISLLAVSSAPVWAQENNMYVLGSVGRGEMSINQTRLDSAATAAGIGSPSAIVDNSTSWKAGAGYQFAPNFAVEATYVNFGKRLRYKNPSATTTGINYRPSSMNLFAVAGFPVSSAFNLFFKGGIAYTRLRADIEEATFSRNSVTKINVAWGAGAEMKVSSAWSFRAEYESFGSVGDDAKFNPNSGTGTGTLSLISAGFVYRF